MHCNRLRLKKKKIKECVQIDTVIPHKARKTKPKAILYLLKY